MDLQKYFESAKGVGVLSTADSAGVVNSAVYALPRVLDGEHVAFVMLKRRSYDNVCQNRHACYLFLEQGKSFYGKRLYLTMVDTDQDERARQIREKHSRIFGPDEIDKHTVYFHVDQVRQLVD